MPGICLGPQKMSFGLQIRAQVQRVGLRNTMSQLRRTPLREWPSRWFFPAAVQHGMGPPPGNGGRSGPQESHEAKLERISKRVQQLPTEEFMDREEIEALPLHQLKVRLGRMYSEPSCS